MALVGGGNEGGITLAVFGCPSEDGTAVYLHLREVLLELCHLRGSHHVELVDIDEQGMSESHLEVETVGEIDVVEEVGAQFRRKNPVAERALAAALLSYEHRLSLVAMQRAPLPTLRPHRAPFRA